MTFDSRSVSLRGLVAGVIALGAVSIGMVIYSQWLSSRGFEDNANLVRLTQSVQQEVATAHLWFEEALGGDTTIDIIEDVHVPIRTALALVEARLASSEAGMNEVEFDDETTESLKSLRDRIALFDELVDSRWRTRDSTGVIGGAADQAFDDVFRDILGHSTDIATQIDSYIARDRQRIYLINGGILVVLALLFSALTYLIVVNRRSADKRASVLANMVQARTAKLAARELEAQQRSRELAIARDQADAASEAKSQFLANMSHEIRTPMNGVVGMASLLMRTELSEVQKEYVETMHNSGLSLLKIINAVLDFSKIEAGKVRLDTEYFAITSVVEDSIQLFSADAERKGLSLVAKIDPDIPQCVRGDPVRLGQVFSNLISNAIKFSSEGEIVVSCRVAGNAGDDPVKLAFDVSDPGIGIPENHQDKLFEHFAQVDESSTRQYGGTGLGLAICKELVTLMGGQIGLSSEPGQGCTFWFTIPFETGTEADLQAKVPRGLEYRPGDLAAIEKRWKHIDEKVLVVDDNEVNLLVAQRMLEELGFEVDLAVNGQEAIELASRDKYAAIIIDSQMPGMDGNEATSMIRASEGEERYTPIVALTANVTAPDRQLAFAAGVDDYLSKPVFLEDLHASLSRLLPDENGHIEVVSHNLRQSRPDVLPIFDADMVEELRTISSNGDGDLFTELAGKFLSQMPEWLDEIREHANSGNRDMVRRQAHKLLGLCLQIGAIRMAQACDDLETFNDDCARAEIDRGIELLFDEFASADRVLKDRFLS